ncbi:MAG: glycerophosphodiester phosphodiesterase, partial [Muribaculaceae bacterium]|nr:glycerophosphodiester phosphodiesterase [Muribaculaceae bacterium]
DRDVKVIAHRGYWTAPGSAQNSIDALIKADSVGCYGTEFDVWLTSDSVLVVNHDGWINGYGVQYTPAEIICAQKIENGETIPTLEAYFEEAVKHPNLRLICEMKFPNSKHQESEMARKICEMAKKFNLEDRIDYITFSRDGMLSLMKYAHKGAKVYYLTGDYVPEQLKFMGAAGADYNYWAYQRNPQWVQQLKDLGLEINVWTVDNEDEMKWCIDNGVDYITTNYPERFMELQKTYKK